MKQINQNNQKITTDKIINVACQYFLNGDLCREEVRRQVKKIAGAGFQAVYGHARHGLQTPYMSNEWWEIIDIIVEECAAAGMQFAIWDEDYFPSAIAGNRIFWNHPELAAQSLQFTVQEVSAGKQYINLELLGAKLLACFALPKSTCTLQDPIDITKHCGTIRTRWEERRIHHGAYSRVCKLDMPHWRTSMQLDSKTYALKWKPEKAGDYVIVAVQVLLPQGRHNTDILNAKAIAKFIKYTHQEYAQRLGNERMSNLVHSAFMDEPAPGSNFPWSEIFPEEFQAEHGYDLVSFLPHLVLDIDERSPLIRHHYRMTQMRLQCENFLQQIQNWCHEHQILSCGHLSRTEYLGYVAQVWPNELRCCKYLDIPCTDPLGAGLAWPDAAAYHVGIKVVSSSAHLFNKKQAGSDALAVMGNEASLRDFKFAVDYQMVLGITFFNMHGLSYSFDGPRKDEVPPSLFYQHSQWSYMSELIEYTKASCATLVKGEHLCQIGMLYPSTSFYCNFDIRQDGRNTKLERNIHQLAESLLSHQKDFDLIDEITMAELNGYNMPEQWKVIILPFLEYISYETAKALTNFAKQGGRILIIGSIPELLGSSMQKALLRWENPPGEFHQEINSNLLKTLPGPELFGEGKENIFILQRKNGDERIDFLFNRAEQTFNGQFAGEDITVPAKGSLLLDDSSRQKTVEKYGTPIIINSPWQIRFSENQLPLALWQVSNSCETQVHWYNLLERQKLPFEQDGKQLRFHKRFLYSGEIKALKIVFDKSALQGEWSLFLNNCEVFKFEKERIYDCDNLSAELSSFLRSGSTPTENILELISSGEGCGLFEMPYFYGDFVCEYRHAWKSLPFLQSNGQMIQTHSLLPWKELGYPTYSGIAEYHCEFTIGKAAIYRLDLGRVEDIAEVFIDGNKVAVMPWPPYHCNTGMLQKGKHQLMIRVCNGPGNHDRLAMLTAGLLGPVKLSPKIT